MSVPLWFAEFQARFGEMLQRPLDRSTGRLRAAVAAYDPRLCDEALEGRRASSRERLAVYNRQYWFRLFGLMATEFPLSVRLVGHWRFNDLVTRYLLEHPPSGWDIERVPDAFEAFVAVNTPPAVDVVRGTTLERDAFLQATSIDAAWRRLFHAPADESYRPSAADARLLLAGRLQLSDRVAFVEERWPLLELRRTLAGDSGESAVPLPARLPAPRFWALVRTAAGIGDLALEPAEARLFELLREQPLSEALARLEGATAVDERADLPAKARAWLARSVNLGFWKGIESQ